MRVGQIFVSVPFRHKLRQAGLPVLRQHRCSPKAVNLGHYSECFPSILVRGFLLQQMNIIRLIIAGAMITLVWAAPAVAKTWRGIVPLRSNRTTVESLLGPPQAGTRHVYVTATETVLVIYADRPCAAGWQVPIDTVISFSVSPKNPLKLAEVKLEESKYEKRKDNHLDNLYYYVSENEGINWTVDTSHKEL
jgi:hypothetical protein